jgi:hypothetical protein
MSPVVERLVASGAAGGGVRGGGRGGGAGGRGRSGERPAGTEGLCTAVAIDAAALAGWAALREAMARLIKAAGWKVREVAVGSLNYADDRRCADRLAISQAEVRRADAGGGGGAAGERVADAGAGAGAVGGAPDPAAPAGGGRSASRSWRRIWRSRRSSCTASSGSRVGRDGWRRPPRRRDGDGRWRPERIALLASCGRAGSSTRAGASRSTARRRGPRCRSFSWSTRGATCSSWCRRRCCAGRSSMRFDIDADDMRMRFDGAELHGRRSWRAVGVDLRGRGRAAAARAAAAGAGAERGAGAGAAADHGAQRRASAGAAPGRGRAADGDRAGRVAGHDDPRGAAAAARADRRLPAQPQRAARGGAVHLRERCCAYVSMPVLLDGVGIAGGADGGGGDRGARVRHHRDVGGDRAGAGRGAGDAAADQGRGVDRHAAARGSAGRGSWRWPRGRAAAQGRVAGEDRRRRGAGAGGRAGPRASAGA